MKDKNTGNCFELTEYDVHLFKEGNHHNLYNKMGSHVTVQNGVTGTQFRVWAPNAKSVAVIGDFNGWDPRNCPMNVRWDGSGIWEGFIPDVGNGEVYKYHIVSNHND